MLDTNAFSALITNDPRMSSSMRRRLAASERIVLPSVVFYEIGQKVRLGKWDGIKDYIQDLEDIALRDGFEILSLSSARALYAALMEWEHRDPFDRMIAAMTLHENLPLVSMDRIFDEVGVERIWS